MNTFKFPDDFLWGTSTAAHQIEGNNTNNDWWAWENRKDRTGIDGKWPLEPSLNACDSYNRYEEDFDLCAKLNNNAVRIGIEWSRIEPKEGEFNNIEIEHYKKVLKAAKERNLKTFVTLHHFTTPNWMSEKGGWTNSKIVAYFSRYSKKCAQEFGDLVDVFLTINEPQVYALVSYVEGRWPPQQKSLLKSLIVQINMIRAHNNAYKSIKSAGDYSVGIVKNIVWYRVSQNSEFKIVDTILAKFIYWLGGFFFINKVKNNLDLLGLNYYFTTEIMNLKRNNPDDIMSDLNWWLCADGLENILLDLKKTGLPVYITENGLADANDKHRSWYLNEILKSCANALEKGANLKGYFHWSLIDNYEWAEGFWPKFGLVEIERGNNLKRTPRESFYKYSDISKSGTIKK